MKSFLILTSLLNLATVNCLTDIIPAHPTPEVSDTNLCPSADEHLANLCKADSEKNKYCCEVDAKTKKGKNFTQFCIEKQSEGVWLNPKCLSEITSCDMIDSCTKSK